MTTFLHALQIDSDKCRAKLNCLRVCPTNAIRVRQGKAEINSTLCIDCGECITACKEGAIQPLTDTWDTVEKYPYKVAIPAPTLYGQFPLAVSPKDIADGLLAIGFDEVYDLSVETELINRAIRDYLKEYKGPLPVISSTCPVIVRLIQVSYPDMVRQILPIFPPREIAGWEMKAKVSAEKGIPPEDIGAIYISPCPAKLVSIKQPAEDAKSYLDVGIGIKDIYNPLLAAITKRLNRKNGEPSGRDAHFSIRSRSYLRMAHTGGISRAVRQTHSISVAQLQHVIHVFEDIEKGKIKNAEFLECYSCTSGCVGGPLTVDKRFVVRSKIQSLINEIKKTDKELEEEVARRYVKGRYLISQQIKPRPTSKRTGDLSDRIKQVKTREIYRKIFPGIDCGLCGAPTCEEFAGDVAVGDAKPTECIFVSDDRLKVLRELYDLNEGSLPEDKNS
ncbi:MAG: 4Fe-4S binding protein [Candidatus Eisenbacteria bacterium]|uniref:4Fe-4S binding protein n=1 Tax=Eiseniibacteriota bacterium TaxID=2212470 RepID=A0A948RX27_UNCEI|nr:4Fe-4S binding protein [Candidatus Eisenbacteria bacterium]MBU1948889.1 4Fe-4S binding protein [Candidatus Eisenbacteria bacterium]MBU2691546.1 4Fe-4S binding protein [Candidatus Eisenbacteria bacterium]